MATNSKSPRDRRVNDRFYLDFSSKYRSTASTFRASRTLDLSLSGVRVELDESLAIGSTLTLNLRPEPLKNLSMQGKVVWCRPSWKDGVFEAGIEFSDGCKADVAWLGRRFKDLSRAVDKALLV